MTVFFNLWTVVQKLEGNWMVMDCVTRGRPQVTKRAEGTSFRLTDTSQVVWQVGENGALLPLTACDAYEVLIRESKGDGAKNIHLRFGSYRGHVLDFVVMFVGEELVLKNRSGVLWCKKIADANITDYAPAPYTLASALNEGYFTDMEIIADNLAVFRVHSTVLTISAPEMDWSAKPPPLTGLPEDVLRTALHFLYAHALPESLTQQTAADTAVKAPLRGLTDLCHAFACHARLQDRVADFVSDVAAFAKSLSNAFPGEAPTTAPFEPPRFCAFIKRTAQSCVVYVAKFVLIVQYYDQNKDNISSEAIHRVLLFVQTQWPWIWSYLRKFLCNMMDFVSKQSVSSRLDLASSLVPEIEAFFDEVTVLVDLTSKVVEAILKRLPKTTREEKFGKTLTPFEEEFIHSLIQNDYIRFENLRAKLYLFQDELKRRREMFESLNSVLKVRNVSANLEQIFEEYHLISWRLEQSAGKLSCRIWNHPKFCFQVASAKVCDFLNRLKREKMESKELMIHLCQFVGRKKFSQLIVEMGLIETADMPETSNSDNPTPKKQINYEPGQLNLTKMLFSSPDAASNPLASAAAEILDKNEKTDMIFEVIEPDLVVRFPAHRVIVAARCVWFRRALTSGMQEDIKRRVQVHNCSVQLFELFLKFLYSGRLPAGSLICHQFIELLVLADCYEVDSLKTVCEENLKRFLGAENVFEFLDWAEKLNAPNLKMDCICLISDNEALMGHEAFNDLPPSTKHDVAQLLQLRREATDDAARGLDNLKIGQ